VQARDLLVYRVLGRDQAVLIDLVHNLLEPLTKSLGALNRRCRRWRPTYSATRAIATEAARRLHISVRTVTYRIAKVKALTGHNPADPTQRLALHMAVVEARLLDWPASPLPRPPMS
jgi:hypothetical protein